MPKLLDYDYLADVKNTGLKATITHAQLATAFLLPPPGFTASIDEVSNI